MKKIKSKKKIIYSNYQIRKYKKSHYIINPRTVIKNDHEVISELELLMNTKERIKIIH